MALVVQDEIGLEHLAAADLVAAGREDDAVARVADIEQLVGRADGRACRKREQADRVAEDAHALAGNEDAAAGIAAVLVQRAAAVVALVVADDVGRTDEGRVAGRIVRRGTVVLYRGRDVDAVVAIAEFEAGQAARADHVAGDEIRQEDGAGNADAVIAVAADDIAGADEVAVGTIAEDHGVGRAAAGSIRNRAQRVGAEADDVAGDE